ncbi:MAG TPA: alpha-isopropylmalate synthase regulatory domain-containing protein, partial [Polyangiaceae bacterium]|nr:alpha-isopropylmalate synthase regulatory domain-containing protein [Polyangiaceae bacterium]
SGRHGFAARLRELGHPLDGEALEAAFNRFKLLADKKKLITDADLEALAASETGKGKEYFTLDAVQVMAGSGGMPTATVRLRGPDGALHVRAAVGTGPVHATFKAIDEVVNAPAELLEYAINNVTEGIDALGHASVRVRAGNNDGRVNPQHGSGQAPILHGHAADTDVIVASAKAYLNAMNRVLAVTNAYDAKSAPRHEPPKKSGAAG